MLSRIIFKSGSSPNEPSLELDLSAVTVFVGPNNSGKSRALVEIENFATKSHPGETKLIQSIEFLKWTSDEFKSALSKVEAPPGPGEVHHADHMYISRLKPQNNAIQRAFVHIPTILNEATSAGAGHSNYHQYLNFFTLRMNGQNRLTLTSEQSAGDLQSAPTNNLAKLFVDNDLLEEIRRIVFDAFGQYLVIDPTKIGSFRLRLSPRPPSDEREEKGWDEASREFHANAVEISEASDGVKAFVGMLSTVIAGEPKVSLIDEPEAFLHPALCARLGKELSKALADSNRRLFVSTHSAAFLMGCVQSGVPINIVRLTYDYKVSTARLLAMEKLSHLMRNPLLRSVGVLNALFYNAVVVTEADADRAFYQEINERLLQSSDSRGIEGCLFLNAQNKQTIWDIVHPLRELGIPCVGICDIDVIKEGGVVWQKPMNGAFVPSLSHASLGLERANLLKAFNDTGKDFKREGGINVLPAEQQQACNDFFSRLATYGIFVVDRGEIENWLPDLGVSTNKNAWLTSIFAAMGEDPTDKNFVHPGNGDVWDFMGSIKNWTSNPQRLGIPA